MNFQEISNKITAHLKRFEEDAEINLPHSVSLGQPTFALSHAFHLVFGGGADERCYVYYNRRIDRPVKLTKKQAAEYLSWLDAGNTGKWSGATAGDLPTPQVNETMQQAELF